MLVVYVPFLDIIFETIPLRLLDWAIIIPLALLPFIVGEFFKVIYYRGKRALKA